MTGALTAVLLVGAAAAKKSSSFSPIILIYAVIAAAFYFLYYRPRKRKAQEAREVAKAWDVGDEVLTAGGIVGYIIDIDGDRVTLETSVGASFVVLKQYVIRKIEPVVADDDLEDYEEDDRRTRSRTRRSRKRRTTTSPSPARPKTSTTQRPARPRTRSTRWRRSPTRQPSPPAAARPGTGGPDGGDCRAGSTTVRTPVATTARRAPDRS